LTGDDGFIEISFSLAESGIFGVQRFFSISKRTFSFGLITFFFSLVGFFIGLLGFEFLFLFF